MLGLMTILLAGHAVPAESLIRDRRSAYNAAIAAHDLAAIAPVLAPDYVVLPGMTGTPLSKDGLLALFGKAFRDPSFVTYVRTPDRVRPSSPLQRIAETGHWTGRWAKPDGRMTETGVYQAMWVMHDGRWALINESFVTLSCKGSRACRP